MRENRPVRNEGLRSSCFNTLAVLCAQFGEDVPRIGLSRGALSFDYPDSGPPRLMTTNLVRSPLTNAGVSSQLAAPLPGIWNDVPAR